jgi:3-phosphoshikimate 1-carboxyvinyltransferase
VCRALGAEITEKKDRWIVRGITRLNDKAETLKRCNAGNSGTTLFLALAAASLGSVPVEFDGDSQLRRRSAAPLLKALAGLGVNVNSAPDGCAPITVCGPWKGGRVSLPCPTSQYLSALLFAAPLAPRGAVTEIEIPLLNEKPYVEMTLSYLDSQGIPYEAAEDFSFFRIPGGSAWKPFIGPVPGDFSSAAFPAAAAAITGGPVTLIGLDPDDTQGDKAIFGFLEKMGCRITWEQIPTERISLGQYNFDALEAIGCQSVELNLAEWKLTVSRRGSLKGGEFDLNATPDLLPPLAAAASFAMGDTSLVNIAHARLKETDRIAALAEELGKLGVKTTERPDGLVIHGRGGIPADTSRKNLGNRTIKTDGHGDHRIVMALACAALGSSLPIEITGAESAAISYPGFLELFGAEIISTTPPQAARHE